MTVNAAILDEVTQDGAVEKKRGFLSRMFNKETGTKVLGFAKKAAVNSAASVTTRFAVGAVAVGAGASVATGAIIAAAGAGVAVGAIKFYNDRKDARARGETVAALNSREGLKSLFKTLTFSTMLSTAGGYVAVEYGETIARLVADNGGRTAAGFVAAQFSNFSSVLRGLDTKIADLSNAGIRSAVSAFNNPLTKETLAQFFAPVKSSLASLNDVPVAPTSVADVVVPLPEMPEINLADLKPSVTPDAETLIANQVSVPEMPKLDLAELKADAAPVTEEFVLDLPPAPEAPGINLAAFKDVAPEPEVPAAAPLFNDGTTAQGFDLKTSLTQPAPVVTPQPEQVVVAAAPAQPLFSDGTSSQGFGLNATWQQSVPAETAVAAPVVSLEKLSADVNTMMQDAKISSKVKAIVAGAVSGDAQNMKDLGVYMLHGTRGVPQNTDKALELFRAAAAAGNEQARFDLAKMGMKGEYGVTKEPKASIGKIRELASEGFRPAKTWLAHLGGTGKTASAAMHKAASAAAGTVKDHVAASSLSAPKVYEIGCKGDFSPGTTTTCSGGIWSKIKDGQTVRLPIVHTQTASNNPLSQLFNAIPDAIKKIHEVANPANPLVKFDIR